jgi:hypothetical protein
MRSLYSPIIIPIIASLLPTVVESFSLTTPPSPTNNVASTTSTTSLLSVRNEDGSVDVSDLGLTMEDFNKPLPKELLASIERSGYQSTSRIPDVEDDGCYWIESNNMSENYGTIDVTLVIPGLRGQPAGCLSVLFSTTTVSVSAFGMIVWSCIQKGISNPDGCSFLIEDGKDMVPIIQMSVEKRDKDKVWDGFILQVGEDSIL